MWALLAKTVLPSIFKTVDKVIKGKDEAEKLKQEVQLALMASENEWKKSAAEVIKSEATCASATLSSFALAFIATILPSGTRPSS